MLEKESAEGISGLWASSAGHVGCVICAIAMNDFAQNLQIVGYKCKANPQNNSLLILLIYLYKKFSHKICSFLGRRKVMPQPAG